MKNSKELVETFNLKDYLSKESLEKLLSDETTNKAANLTDMKSLQDLLDDLNLPELGENVVIIDDGPALVNENPGWGPCFGGDPVHYHFGKEPDKKALTFAVQDYEGYRFSPKAPGGRSSRNTATEGAVLGAAVGVVCAGAAGAAGVVAGSVGVAIGSAIVVGAVAGAVGAKISQALRD